MSIYEKSAKAALEAYRKRSLVETQFDDLKNDLEFSKLRTHGANTMHG
ncbi:MAG: hypothetical protein LBO66_12440 [Deltaproteobacteria bacterium]|jgi:transposase|nr:hypothetical protein [Deltaproteobacteria bacterium]